MAKVVHREILTLSPEPQVLPIGRARILHTKQGRREKNTIDIWYETDPDYWRYPDEAHRDVIIIGTGERISNEYSHLGTVVCENGFVWHIYVKGVLQHGVVV